MVILAASRMPHEPRPVLDPTQPVMAAIGPYDQSAPSTARQNQRLRRAVILSAIRRLLIEEGHKGVTVRRIAELSGHVVQTVYNLVGPRDHAIVEAISDYTQYVGSLAPPDPEDPLALMRAIDWQGRSVLEAPAFTRQVCQIAFTESRHIFWTYRERQIRNLSTLMARQKRAGVIRRDVDCRVLARDLMLLSGSIFIDWSDGVSPDEELVPSLVSAYAHLLSGVISPRHGGMAALPLTLG